LKKVHPIKHIKAALKARLFKIQSVVFVKLICSKNAWRLFDDAGIEGFGLNLLRLYFPVYYDKKTNRQSFSPQFQQKITQLISTNEKRVIYNQLIIDQLKEIVKLPILETDNITPYLDNYFFGVYDAAVLYAIMKIHKPRKIIEIGSGISTRYSKYFKGKLGLNTAIICIDPVPRADINDVADKIITQPLENVILTTLFDLQSDDIVFMDGSHYVFQGNDTLTFFFTLLPSLPKGIIIHIHDIYLPFDYPEGAQKQLWTEQYILAGMMLGGFSGFEVIYPNYYISQTNDEIKKALVGVNDSLDHSQFNIKLDHTAGTSFWIRKN
jgi:hypothetical protein